MSNAYTISDHGYLLGEHGYTGARVVDGFERGNINPYTGATGAFSATTARSAEGSYALEYNDSTNRSLLSMPGDGLPYYPVRGDTIRFSVNFQSLGDTYYFGFAHGSGEIEEDNYQVEFKTGAGELELVDDTGPDESLALTGCNFAADSWDECEIDWHSGGIDVSYRGSTLSSGDTARDTGGILFFGTGGQAWWDSIRAV